MPVCAALSIMRRCANTKTMSNGSAMITATASNQTAGILAAASGRAGTGQVVSTTGVRGLSEEELKAAKFNETEIKTLESYTLNADQGRQFANAGNLKPIAFTNLKAAKGGAK